MERNKKSSTSWKLRTVNTLMQGTQFESSLIKNLSKFGVFSMPTPIEEMIRVVLVNYEFGYGEERKLKCFLWKFWTIKILMLEKRTMINQLYTLLQVFFFNWDFDGGNRTVGGSEVKIWKSSETKMESHFWNISNITNSMHGSNQKSLPLNRPPHRIVFVGNLGWRNHNCN